jgi:hypothetical protein
MSENCIPDDLRLAFHDAVVAPFNDWYFGGREPRIELRGYRWTVGAICFFASSFTDEMPDPTYAVLYALANAFSVRIPADRSYASGAFCLVDICDQCLARRAARPVV